jgi:hypothetical protein
MQSKSKRRRQYGRREARTCRGSPDCRASGARLISQRSGVFRRRENATAVVAQPFRGEGFATPTLGPIVAPSGALKKSESGTYG